MISGGTIEVSESERSIYLKGRYDEVEAARSQIMNVDNSGSCDAPAQEAGVIAPGSPTTEIIVGPPSGATAGPADKSERD